VFHDDQSPVINQQQPIKIDVLNGSKNRHKRGRLTLGTVSTIKVIGAGALIAIVYVMARSVIMTRFAQARFFDKETRLVVLAVADIDLE